MRKPLMIVVSGAPGSGKTTLAANLAAYLQLPHVPRDVVLRGIEMTRGHSIDRGGEGIERYFSALEHMCGAHMSLVTDGTLYAGISEDDFKGRLAGVATIVNVHVRAKNEYERFVQRESRREGWSNEWVEGYVDRLKEIYDQTAHPLDLGAPCIEVDATREYDPSLPEIVKRIRTLYPDTRQGITAR